MAKSSQRQGKVTVSKIRMLASLQCSEVEAAAELGISKTAFAEMLRIDVKAREVWERGKADGRTRIRRAQFGLAERNAQMAIFLGKQYLGQTEIQVVEHSGRDGGPIKTLDLTKLDQKGRDQLREILALTRVKK